MMEPGSERDALATVTQPVSGQELADIPGFLQTLISPQGTKEDDVLSYFPSTSLVGRGK